MFLPKPLVALLFLIAIVSTISVLYLLSKRPSILGGTPVATTTILVGQPVSPSVFPSPPRTVPSEFVADSSWKTATSSALGITLDYPSNWQTVASDSASLAVYSSILPTVPYLVITREKKRFLSDTLTRFVSSQEERYKEQGYILSRSRQYVLDRYSAIDRLYTQNDIEIREIVFSTKFYFYIVFIKPQSEDRYNVVDEILRSVRVL